MPPTDIFILAVKYTTFMLGAMQGCILGVSAERIYSTIKYKTYENSKNFLIPTVILGFSLAYAFPNYLIWEQVTLGHLNFFIIGAINFVIQFLCAGSLFMTLHFNNKLRIFSNSANLILTERYQIHENLRMARFALPFLLLSIIGTILAGFFNTVFHIISINNVNSGLSPVIGATIYFLLVDIFMFVGLVQLQMKRNSASMKLLNYFQCTKNRRTHPSRVDALGRNIIEFDKEEVAHIYFEQLRRTW
ncbi:hypothetical protein FO519_000886 [Halicephalobus sp. NKZ332]|nr:hypothetical protein FO519_000886 [Halicephalobus sp. NKZ332]